MLLAQIQEATTAQQSVGKVKGAAKARDAKFRLLVTSLESERMMVQALCDENPEEASTLIEAASMTTAQSGLRQKPLLTLKNGLPSGTVLLDANSRLLDSTARRKTYHWQFTTDLGKSFSPMPSTPIARTSIANLPRCSLQGEATASGDVT